MKLTVIGDIPKELKSIVKKIKNDTFAFERYDGKIDKTYYGDSIYVGTLFDRTARTIGYTVSYRGYEIEVDYGLHELVIMQ